jgi:ABC-2 type transport system ATP-binding protein
VTEPVIRVKGLRKAYGQVEAVRGIDLAVRSGEIFAFLGPNGAGKTTSVEILEGYRERSDGEVSVLGIDPAHANREWRERIGIVLQQSRMHPELTVRETLEMFAGYYRRSRSVPDTIAKVGLEHKAETRVAQLSGGQERRLDVGVALVGEPELLFLDEPTTGFDPAARRQFWDVIAGLRDLGKTIFLTTHYMEEAQTLADRVAIIVAGRVAAEGRTEDLGGRETAAARISFTLPDGVAASELPAEAAGALATQVNGPVELSSERPVELLNLLTGWALERGIDLEGLEVRRPSLEDVYLRLTGGPDAELEDGPG